MYHIDTLPDKFSTRLKTPFKSQNSLCNVISYCTDAVGLSLDTKGRKIYFSHEGMALEVANMDGSNRKTLIRELPTSGHHVFFDGIGR